MARLVTGVYFDSQLEGRHVASTPSPVGRGNRCGPGRAVPGCRGAADSLSNDRQPLHAAGGRKIGSTVGITIDRDGTSVWVFERCGAQNCVGSDVAPIVKFDASGNAADELWRGDVRPAARHSRGSRRLRLGDRWRRTRRKGSAKERKGSPGVQTRSRRKSPDDAWARLESPVMALRRSTRRRPS